MLKAIGMTVATAIGAVLVTAAFQPDRFAVSRSSTIAAPPERIFGLISDFHRWQAWSPYERLDPAMRRRFSGPAQGAGAVYEWDGNAKAGKGRMTILAAASPARVAIRLDFEKPLETQNVATFTLEPHGGSTTVTWAMEGPTPYLGKVIHLFLDMDRLVGRDFDTGLAKLKTLAER
jgi:uncharacterized protein YndB with AHSA1/START domain